MAQMAQMKAETVLQTVKEHIFQQITYQHANLLSIGLVIIESQFIAGKSNALINLILTQDHIIAGKIPNLLNQSLHIVTITIDLRFQIILGQNTFPTQIVGIKLITDGFHQECFYTTNQLKVKEWIRHLKKKLHQVGFDQQFRVGTRVRIETHSKFFKVLRLRDRKQFIMEAILKGNLQSNLKVKKNLINRISIMRQLDHKNIVKFINVYQTNTSIYLLYEKIQGAFLGRYISQSETKVSEIKKIMKGILEGLFYLHAKRIAHRSINPFNIYLTSDLKPQIVHFNLAVNVDQDEYLYYKCGTPGFVAPQIVCIKNPTQHIHLQPQCDIFQAGIIFHFLLMKRDLFQGAQLLQVLENNEQMNFNLNYFVYQSLNSIELDLLKKMLEIDAKKRIKASQALQHIYFSSN